MLFIIDVFLLIILKALLSRLNNQKHSWHKNIEAIARNSLVQIWLVLLVSYKQNIFVLAAIKCNKWVRIDKGLWSSYYLCVLGYTNISLL